MLLVLASTSPYRRQLLERLRVPFEVISPEVDETALPNETPHDAALRLSALKARAVARQFPNALIIGSDQIASLNGQHLGKPGNHVAATAQLHLMRGQEMIFHTGLSLYNSQIKRLQSQVILTRVRIRNLTDQQIENYLLRDQPYDCAGSARSEGLGIAIMDNLSGDDPTALIGLPLITLNQMLFNEGYDVLSQ
ncbi:MAG: Maf family nucleotide pyrophosphatase [Betaproteobacteria bacterium]|nr:Maf family nucleotide pyrophosphatase [Betaproteobacteria bacterium]